MSFTFDMKYRNICTLCISYADGNFSSVPTNASAATGFDETEWFVPYLEGLGYYELKQYDQALKALERSIRIMPAVADPYAWLGAVLNKLGRRTDAIAALSQALRTSEHFLEAYYVRGMILFEDGRFADARADFAACARLRPSLTDVQFKLGVSSLEHWERSGRPPGKDLETAQAALSSYLAANPRDPQAYLLRARVLLGLGRPEAEADLNQALSLAPNAVDALAMRALVHESKHQWAQAEKEYDAILEKTTDPARTAELLRKRARVRAKGGRYAEALQDYDALIEKDPKDLGLYLEKGGLQFMAKKLDDALATTQKTFGQGPNHPRILALRAEIFLEKGDAQKALEEATQAIVADPELADALVTRGQAFLKLGRKDEAYADFKKALGKRPDLKEKLDPLIAEADRK
jgi:tetratricopeptide (TPR) repeat protein